MRQARMGAFFSISWARRTHGNQWASPKTNLTLESACRLSAAGEVSCHDSAKPGAVLGYGGYGHNEAANDCARRSRPRICAPSAVVI